MSRRRDARGAVAIVVAILTCFAMLPLAALAVDIGAQRVLRRDMQSLADVVALDMARHLDGKTQAVIKATSEWRGGIADSVTNNLNIALGQPGTHTVSVQQQQADAVATVSNSDLVVTVTMGLVDQSGNFTSPIPYPDVPNAVQVVASSTIAHSFVGGFGGATRSAIASAGGGICYRAGSFALGLATNKSILSPILGDAAAARVLSYNGLATANVSLLGLATKLAAGTPEQLLNASNISVGDVLDASATLLTEQGDTGSLDLASQLGQLKTDLGPLADDPVDFAQILDIGQGNGSALDADINVLDIITSGLIVANGVNSVAVPSLNLNVLGTTLTASLYITQAPKIGCNGGAATSAQGYVKLSGTISLLGLATLKNIALTVSLANASATHDAASGCAPDHLDLDVSDQTLADVRLKADVYALLGLIKLATIDTGAPPSAADHTYSLPLPDSYTDPVTTNSGSLGLDLTNADVNVLGILNVGSLVTALAPLVNGVGTLLTGTLLPALGITTAGVDLWAQPTVTCSTTKLVG